MAKVKVGSVSLKLLKKTNQPTLCSSEFFLKKVSNCIAGESIRFFRLKFLISPAEKNRRVKLETLAKKTGCSRRPVLVPVILYFNLKIRDFCLGQSKI